MAPSPEQLVERANGIHSAIAADLAPAGGLLRCSECKREQLLGDVAGYLRDGWPKCCGYTMLWVTQRLLDEERNA